MTQSNILGITMRRRWRNQVADCVSAMLMLLCGLGVFQPLAQAAEKPPYWGSERLYEPREGGGEREVYRWRCPSETRSEPVLKSSDSSPVLQVVLLKAEDSKKLPWQSLWFHLKAEILISKNFPQYFQCGRPVDLQKLQKTISEINTNVLQDALKPGETSREELDRLATQYTLAPTASMGSDGVLSLEVIGKVIQDVQISTRCDWENNTIDTSGTIAVRGQKPDESIRRVLGLGKGDRYPLSEKGEEIITRIGALETLRGIQSHFAIDGDPNKLTWVICVWQKTEAELAMAEARQINIQNTESARQAIAKYQEALSLLKQPKTVNSGKEKLKKFQLMERQGGSFKVVLEDDEKGTLIGIASTYTQLGEFYQALNYYQQALSAIRATGKKGEEAGTLMAIADIYNTLGDQQTARRYYQQALSVSLEKRNQQHRQQTRGTP